MRNAFTVRDAFQTAVSAGTGSSASFSYTVLGSEPDLTALVITLPNPRSNASYGVGVEMTTHNAFLLHAVVNKTTTQFTLQLSAPATAGDKFDFYVQSY